MYIFFFLLYFTKSAQVKNLSIISQFFNFGCDSSLFKNSSNPFYLCALMDEVRLEIFNFANIFLAGIDGTIIPFIII